MAAMKVDPQQIIDEYERRGVTIEPDANSTAGINLAVHSSWAAIPSWLNSTLQSNLPEVSLHIQQVQQELSGNAKPISMGTKDSNEQPDPEDLIDESSVSGPSKSLTVSAVSPGKGVKAETPKPPAKVSRKATIKVVRNNQPRHKV